MTDRNDATGINAGRCGPLAAMNARIKGDVDPLINRLRLCLAKLDAYRSLPLHRHRQSGLIVEAAHAEHDCSAVVRERLEDLLTGWASDEVHKRVLNELGVRLTQV